MLPFNTQAVWIINKGSTPDMVANNMQTTEKIQLERVKLFKETPSIASQLPIFIEDIEIEELIVRCSECKTIIPDELIHGYATKPLPNTASFQAIHICPHCRTISESIQRIKRTGKNRIAVDKRTPSGKWLHSEMSTKDVHWLVRWMKWLLGMK